MKDSTEQCASAAMDVRSHKEILHALGYIIEREGQKFGVRSKME